MADLALANSTYAVGTSDTASTLVNNVTATDAQQYNGVASAAVGIETILGTGTTLKGNKADLVARLATCMDADGILKLSTDSAVTGPLSVAKGGTGVTYNLVPTGTVMSYPMLVSPPTGFLACDGTAVSRATYSDLFAALTDSGTITVTIASPGVVTWTAHGRSNGDPVSFTTTGALPTGITAGTIYYVSSATTDTFQLVSAIGAAAINTSGTQSGVHTGLYAPYGRGDGSTTFNLPIQPDDVFGPWNVVATGAGSTITHEGTTVISSNQALSGTHLYTNLTINSGVTVTPATGSRFLAIYASNRIIINGTIAANATGVAGGSAVTGTNAGNVGSDATDQPGGSGGSGGGGGGAGGSGGDAYCNATQISSGATQISGSSVPFTVVPTAVVGGAGGGSGGGGSGTGGGGGRGGSSIVLVAPSIVLGPAAILNTSGASGSAVTSGNNGGAGGGGAGNVYVVARSYVDEGATFTMNGGNAGSLGGGSGGAGTAGADGVKQVNIVTTNRSLGATTSIIKY